MPTPPSLVLASTSRYRAELLGRLAIPFQTARPQVDETPLPEESPQSTAERLAEAKARAVAQEYPDALIIGSDQVAYLDKQIFGKPGDAPHAIAQLRTMRGQTVIFHTALAVLNTRTQRLQQCAVPTQVKFRKLSDEEIDHYVALEQPFDCAGSAKSEGLGITLLEALSGDDPTALIGLPLIALSHMLRQEGLQLP